MADTPEATAKGTTYIVLEESQGQKLTPGPALSSENERVTMYQPIGEATVKGGDKKAITTVLAQLGRAEEEGSSFVAVPARSFKVRTRKQETRTLWG